MDGPSYWLLRCQDALLVRPGATPEEVFPSGLAADFSYPEDALPVGEWQGLPCHAAEVDRLPEHVTGELTPLRRLFGVAGAEAFALAGPRRSWFPASVPNTPV